MDSDLYDEFGNYIGPDVDDIDSDEEEEEGDSFSNIFLIHLQFQFLNNKFIS